MQVRSMTQVTVKHLWKEFAGQVVLENVNLHVGDPTPIIQLTKGDCYQAPVIEDLFNHEVIYDKSPAGDDVPRYIDNLAPLLNLFPAEVDGLHRIAQGHPRSQIERKSYRGELCVVIHR